MRFENIKFEEVFGHEPTIEQIWWLVKLVRHTRQYCRNNAALKNYLSMEFKNFRFSMVDKEDRDGHIYKGLQIDEV